MVAFVISGGPGDITRRVDILVAHNLKMRVVAEGVELRDQLVYLKTAGCDAAQGYILSRPVPAQETQRLLRQGILEPA